MLHATVVIVRVLTAGMAVCVGLLVGPFAFPASWGVPSERAVLLVMALSVLLPLVLLAGSVIQVQRGERVLRQAVREGAAELWGGDVRGTGSPGLVEYSAPPRHGDPPAAVCVTNGPGGQGRVVVPVPVPLPRGTPVALLLHPRREEVAVFDVQVDHDALRDAAGWDPAWTGIRMPGRVAALGGGGVMLALALLGLAVGAAVSFSILALVPGAVGA